MLRVAVPEVEYYDEVKNEFVKLDGCTLQLEHSLVSISKWESKWNKPFLGKTEKTREESIDYIRCMTVSPSDVDPRLYYALPKKAIESIHKYIEAPMTATWFNERNKHKAPPRKVITSEVIYSWMIALEIPFECQKWHLNRLLTLIHVCDINNNPQKGGLKGKELMKQNRALNAARRAKSGSKG